MNLKPLVVDLDGTLIHTDMLHESVLSVVRQNPFIIPVIIFLIFKGKASLKKFLASRFKFDPKSLPYNNELIRWLTQQRADGRKLILCTASDIKIATVISEHLLIFDEVIASNGIINIAGQKKAEVLVQRFGYSGFDYVGNSATDLQVWKHSYRAVVVYATNSLTDKVRSLHVVEKIFPSKTIKISSWVRVLRLHQWLKNSLLFIPLLAAHQLLNSNDWVLLILAFFSFSICASSVYITNDLFDLESDRMHPRKQYRPFASGLMPIWFGVALAPMLLVLGIILATYVGGKFIPWLLFYFILTVFYSLGLKRLLLVDCITLAMLYTLRIVAGAAVLNHNLSFWLLAFSVFLFLSLAFVKRYSELEIQLLSGIEKVHGRGYFTSDASLIQTMGITSGYSSVLVLALYLNSDAVIKLYKTPQLIWGAVPIMLFWISWMWMQAHRGNMHDDPLVFAVKDKASLFAGVLFVGILAIGTIGLQW